MFEKKILWKSDLWRGTVTFGVITIFCLVAGSLDLVRGDEEGAFTMAAMGFIPLMLTIVCAFTNRANAMQVWAQPDVEQDLLERSGVLKESCLNPENPVNAERIRNPPTIG